MVLAQQLWSEQGMPHSFNFGPALHEACPVKTVIDLALQAYGCGLVNYADTPTGPHEAGLLKLDVSQTAHVLGFEAKFTLQQAVQKTMHWYRLQHQGMDATALCEGDIRDYEATL
jgi:CDP-glucose 4,6-dehydratase